MECGGQGNCSVLQDLRAVRAGHAKLVATANAILVPSG
jgi:hypothetical protein